MDFTIKTKIKASAKELYTTWLDSTGHSKMTGGEASVSDQVGDHFTAWDGYIKGKNLVLDPHKRIVQTWRTTQFKEHEPDSQIVLQFEELDEVTEMTLLHRNLPESGGHYKQGWVDHYFDPMKAYFEK
jgi:activator of HSP90 ATPase